MAPFNGLLTSVAAAPHIRSGRLVPLIVEHVVDRSSVFFYYGRRPAQPARVRAFIEVTVELLADNPAFVLTNEKLRAAENAGRAAKDMHRLMRAVGSLAIHTARASQSIAVASTIADAVFATASPTTRRLVLRAASAFSF